MTISVLTKAEAFEDLDAICAGVMLALHEMAEAAGVLGVDQDIHVIETSLIDLHTKAGYAAAGKAH